MRTRARFRNPDLQRVYEAALVSGRENFSALYQGSMRYGPRIPRAGIDAPSSPVKAYWSGWHGAPMTWERSSKNHAIWAAGQDNRRRARDMAVIHAAIRELDE